MLLKFLFLFSAFLYTTAQILQDDWLSRQKNTSFHMMMKNINPPGTKRGFFAASLSTFHPDYFYTWTRDAALVARVLTSLPDTQLTIFEDYVDFQIHTQYTSTVCQCLGEPKFNTDGSGYTGSWGRPQNDGPAERAIAFILIGNRILTETHTNQAYISFTLLPAIKRDVDYITQVWQDPSYDLWEEIEGNHFYTLMIMRRALLDTIDFFSQMNYALDQLEHYKSVVDRLQDQIHTFWSQHRIMATQNVRNGVHKPSGLDVSTLIAANLAAHRNDGFFTPGTDKVLMTAFEIERVFQSIYPINQNLPPYLGVSIGRYPEDIYDGYGQSLGNPWFIATATFTELYYLAIKEWKQKGLMVNDINRPFFQHVLKSNDIQNQYYVPGSAKLNEIIDKTSLAADRFLNTIRYHQHRNGSMSEQFDRYIGFMAGARDLTWSHAAVISAIKAKEGTLLV